MIYQYRYKFYLNANHFVIIGGKKGEPHSHCFELTAIVASLADGGRTVAFNDIERAIEGILSPYQNKLLNDVPPFDTVIPTLENICRHFKNEIAERMRGLGWVLLSIEASETPSRSFVLTIDDPEFIADSLQEEADRVRAGEWGNLDEEFSLDDMQEWASSDDDEGWDY